MMDKLGTEDVVDAKGAETYMEDARHKLIFEVDMFLLVSIFDISINRFFLRCMSIKTARITVIKAMYNKFVITSPARSASS